MRKEISSKQLPWKIGAMESGQVGIDDAQDRQVTGWIEPEDAERILRAVNSHDDLLEALIQCRAEILSMIDKHNKQDANDGSWLYDYQTVVEADAAIAKARGES
jgi:hypothetical protein